MKTDIPVENEHMCLCPSHSFSRYSIERVFRPRKLDRAHPRELLECAFDIVTPVTNSLLPDAETIYTISEIIQEFPVLQVTHMNCILNDPVHCCLVSIHIQSIFSSGWMHHCSLFSYGCHHDNLSCRCFFPFHFPAHIPNIPKHV